MPFSKASQGDHTDGAVPHCTGRSHAESEGGIYREGMSPEEGQENEVLYNSVPSHLEIGPNGSLELELPDKAMDEAGATIYTLGEEDEETDTLSPEELRE